MKKIASFIGYWLGTIVHKIKGCEPFTAVLYINRNRSGKSQAPKRKICTRCGKRWDRVCGQWRYMGYYPRRTKK